MKIQVYRSFLTVAQCKSFTQAAEFLNFTQPTISNHISALEETYGVALFVREGKNVYLTAAGQAFVPEAQKILQEYEDSIKFMSAFKEQSMHLKIAVSTQVINSYLLDILSKMKQDFPDLEILVDRRMTIEEILDKTVKEKYYDFAFVHMDVQPLYTKRVRLWQEKLVWVCSRELFERHNESTDVYTYPFISYSDNGVYYNVLLEKVDMKQLKKIISFSDSDTVLEAVKKSMGIAFVPFTKVRDEIEAGRLIKFSDEYDARFRISVLYDYKMDFTQPKKHFLDYLLAARE